MKKSLLILFAIIFAISLNTQAEDFSAVYNGDTIYYNITSSTSPLTVEVTYRGASSISYSNEYSGVVSIPDSVLYSGNYYKVTSIGNYAFYYCSGLTSIEIPNSVTSIGNNAFSRCSGLTSITIPNSVTSIGDYAFENCSGLTSVTIPNSVTSIGYWAFHNCTGLTSITIPNSVTSIGDDAFFNTPYYNNKPDGLVYINNVLYKYKGTMPANTSINVLSGTISISDYAFDGCTGLTSITIPNSVTSIGDNAFRNCTGLTSITIPNSVTSIGNNTFQNCSGLTSITIPNSVTSIGSFAFSRCSGLTSITIPNSVTSIGNQAFYNCSGLTSITIPNSVTSIGVGAFAGCSGLTSITIPNSVTSIGKSAFENCSGLTSVTIPNSVTSIGYGAFDNCTGLTSITIPNSVTSIGNNAFRNCSGLTSITIPNSVTSIGDNAFAYCSGLTSITIPNSVTSIGRSTFENCINLDTVYFNANNCTTMGTSTYYVFTGCVNFRTLIIGDSVQNIPPYAFSNCNSLSSITSKAINPPAVQGSSFSGVSKTFPFYVPCNSIPSYNSAMYWSDFTNYVGIRTPQFIASSICDGSIYTDYGANIDSAGVYTLVNGCDSVILNLSITPSFKTNYYDTICKGVQYSNYGFSFIVDSNGVYIRELQAINGCDSIIQLNLKVIESPTIELDMVTVDMNNNNVVVWDKDEVVNHYNIYKEGNVLNQYDLIATVPYDSASMFVDTNSNPTIKAYMYKISTTDTCLNESELSSFHKTMHLTISQGIGNNWNLYWSPYEGAYYTTYNIYRGLNSLDSLEYLTTISSSNTSYTDIDVPSQIVYYQVEIIKDTNTTNKSGIQSIRSNIVTNNTIGLNNIHKNNITTKLYPNPTEGKAKLEIEGLSNDADVIVSDLLGRVIKKYKFNSEKGILEIDVSGYPKGVYSVSVQNNNINVSKKLIVQ